MRFALKRNGFLMFAHDGKLNMYAAGPLNKFYITALSQLEGTLSRM